MKLFREKSLTKVSTPEQLNDYMKVTSTPIWINLIAVIFLLMGICMWAMIGQLKTTISVEAQGDAYTSQSEIETIERKNLQIGAEIHCDKRQGKIVELIVMKDSIRIIGGFDEVLPKQMTCEITTSSQSWFSLLFPFGKPLLNT